MLKKKNYLFILSHLVYLFTGCLASWEECGKLQTQISPVHLGWPFQISCGIVVKDENTCEKLHCLSGTLTCRIRENILVVLEEETTWFDIQTNPKELIYSIPDLTLNSSTTFNIELSNNESCVVMKQELQTQDLSSTTCKEQINQVSQPNYDEVFLGGSKTYDCSTSKPPNIYAPEDELSYSWTKNCSDIPNENTNQLTLKNMSFDDAGYYTCSVTYNGSKRFAKTKALCVKHKAASNIPIFECSTSTLSVHPGKHAKFECSAVFDEGSIDEIFIKWKRLSFNISNEEEWDKCEFNTSINRPSCTYFPGFDNACYLHIASAEERKPQKTTIAINLTVTDVTDEDYGTYVIKVSPFNDKQSQNVTLVLKRSFPSSIPAIIGVCSAVVVVLLLAVVMAVYNKVYILVMWKKIFQKYNEDSKKYGACLVYQFSQDLDAFAQNNIKSSILKVQSLLEGRGYSVFDQRRNGCDNEETAVQFQNLIDNCHRIVIFLTPEFIKDEWSVLSFNQGFDSMIKSGSKLIFILLPGTKAYLKQHAADDVTCQTVLSAMKINYVIKWPKHKGNFHFEMELEIAMPKLIKNKRSRIYSTGITDTSSSVI